jgi:hypothetical protein
MFHVEQRHRRSIWNKLKTLLHGIGRLDVYVLKRSEKRNRTLRVRLSMNAAAADFRGCEDLFFLIVGSEPKNKKGRTDERSCPEWGEEV